MSDFTENTVSTAITYFPRMATHANILVQCYMKSLQTTLTDFVDEHPNG